MKRRNTWPAASLHAVGIVVVASDLLCLGDAPADALMEGHATPVTIHRSRRLGSSSSRQANKKNPLDQWADTEFHGVVPYIPHELAACSTLRADESRSVMWHALWCRSNLTSRTAMSEILIFSWDLAAEPARLFNDLQASLNDPAKTYGVQRNPGGHACPDHGRNQEGGNAFSLPSHRPKHP